MDFFRKEPRPSDLRAFDLRQRSNLCRRRSWTSGLRWKEATDFRPSNFRPVSDYRSVSDFESVLDFGLVKNTKIRTSSLRTVFLTLFSKRKNLYSVSSIYKNQSCASKNWALLYYRRSEFSCLIFAYGSSHYLMGRFISTLQCPTLDILFLKDTWLLYSWFYNRISIPRQKFWNESYIHICSNEACADANILDSRKLDLVFLTHLNNSVVLFEGMVNLNIEQFLEHW